MSSRALILAAVLLLVGWCAPAMAQENLDAGKSPSQIFAGTCNACHKSPRGLLKTVSPSSLPGFLRQHYTTSPNMAGVLASYLISNGATDTRYGESPKGAKGPKEGSKEGSKEGAKQEARQEPRPDGQHPSEQLDRWGRRIHQTPQEAPAAESKPAEGAPGQAAAEPDGRKNAKQKLSRHGRPNETLPKEEPKPGETAAREDGKQELKPDAAKEAARPDSAKPESPKPADESRSQSAKIEQPAETPAVRPDPVPPVTPAPSTNATSPAAAAPAASQAAAPAAGAGPAVEMAVPLPAGPVPSPPAVTASTSPPQPPVPPAGPPAPPISQ